MVFVQKSLRTSQLGTQNVKTHNRTTQKTTNINNKDHTKKTWFLWI